MRPRSKIQQQFCERAEHLPPPSAKFRVWAKGLFPDEALYYSLRGKHSEFHCLCCGTVEPTFGKWPVDTGFIPKWTCAECGAECEVLPQRSREGWRGRAPTRSRLATLVDVIDGIQVFRTFEVSRNIRRNEPPTYEVAERWQNWVLPDGKEVITHRPYARGYNFFTWKAGDYVIGAHNAHIGGYYGFSDVFDVTDNFFFPRAKFTPVLRRNGMRSKWLERKGLDPVALCRRLLADRMFEEIVKMGYLGVAAYFIDHPNTLLRDYIHAVRIAYRNRYRIKDAGLWLDYVSDLMFLGLDSHNAHYVCPKNLRKAHAETTRRRQRLTALQQERERLKDLAKWEKRYAVAKAPFLGIAFGDGNIVLSVIQSVEDVRQEGEAMHHCVFSNGYYKNPDRVLMSARDASGKRLETVEVGLDPYKVLQSRGLQNGTTECHKAIVALVEANMDLFRTAVPKMTVPLHLTGKNANYYHD